MFKLPELEYSYDALEPFIDRETMELHHSKHHAGYIAKLNKALEGFELDKGASIEKIIINLKKDIPIDIYWDIRNNGGGHLNHSLFFKMMSPKASREPKGHLLDLIKKVFGGFEGFKERFKSSALSRFGSGWAWLLLDEQNKIFIKSTPNQDCPVSDDKKVLLCLDLWEHAYYLNYRNRRGEYIDKWWNVVNWDYVTDRFEEFKN
ncbi:MAG TPA: superoxide dismutase [Fusobacteria bacterium]|nr:superoxide dismutase [Fusobacteriota bacterium]|tara:strand:+ start:86 stop:700 length:615 start_codon:yes stop_codon:yes gene_type:complete